jgi:hypothetical protein
LLRCLLLLGLLVVLPSLSLLCLLLLLLVCLLLLCLLLLCCLAQSALLLYNPACLVALYSHHSWHQHDDVPLESLTT